MNSVVLMGRLTRDPDVRYTQGDKSMAIARYTLAVDRRGKARDGQPSADFISCVALGKSGEFAEKYLHKGTKICVQGHIQTGSYTNKDGQKVYTTDVVVDQQEFAESKNSGSSAPAPAAAPAKQAAPAPAAPAAAPSEFMDIPDGFDAELPFT